MMRPLRGSHLPLDSFRAQQQDTLLLLDWAPPVFNQQQTQACTGFCWKAMVDTAAVSHGLENPDASARFLYANARLKLLADEALLAQLGQVKPAMTLLDQGANLFWMAQMAMATGLATEAECPSTPDTVNVVPDMDAYVAARARRLRPAAVHRITEAGWSRLDALDRSLAARTPPGFGTPVSLDFMSLSPGDGRGPVSVPPENEVVGEHAMCVMGRRTVGGQRYYLLRSSWGEAWGGNVLPDGFAAPPGHAWAEGTWMADDRATDFTVVAYDVPLLQAA